MRQGTKQGDGKRGKVVGGEGGVGRARDGARQGDTRGKARERGWQGQKRGRAKLRRWQGERRKSEEGKTGRVNKGGWQGGIRRGGQG